MIFVTVGTQLPFDRLVGAVDRWAGEHPGTEVFAQVGPSALRPRHLEARPFVDPAECLERMRAARLVVAHAGMGTILTALELGTPIVVMPRVAARGEHRNEHQLATARRLAELGRVQVAFDEAALARSLDEAERLPARGRISPYASERLIGALRAFIEGAPAPSGS